MVRMVESFSGRSVATPARTASAVQAGCSHTQSMMTCSRRVSGRRRPDLLLDIVALENITLDEGLATSRLCLRICAPYDDAEALAAVDWVALFPGRGFHPAHECAVEADVDAVLRQGVGTNRLGPWHAADHRDRPAHVRRVVSRAADLSARPRADDGIPRRSDLTVRTDAGAVSHSGPVDHVPLRMGGTVPA